MESEWYFYPLCEIGATISNSFNRKFMKIFLVAVLILCAPSIILVILVQIIVNSDPQVLKFLDKIFKEP